MKVLLLVVSTKFIDPWVLEFVVSTKFIDPWVLEFVVSTKFIDPWVLEFVVSNSTGNNKCKNCISLDVYFRGLGGLIINNDFTVLMVSSNF